MIEGLEIAQLLWQNVKRFLRELSKKIMIGRFKVQVYSDSQIVVKTVNKKSIVPKDIINLVEDI